ncbi:MAG: efflux RND transporter periplasmic adaptor subunit [Geminicoccaceae bacterium]
MKIATHLRPFATGMIALAAILSAAQPAFAQGGPSPVVVDEVIVEKLSETVSVLGRVIAKRQGVIASHVSAPVADTRVEVGDRVEAGDVLVHLDPTRLEFDRELAEAELAAAEGEHDATLRQLDLLHQERDRFAKLKGSAAFSKARLDDKIAEIAATRSRAEAAKARLERSRVHLAARAEDVEDADIRAPYRGVVVEKHVSAGAYVRVGDPVVVMVDAESIEIEADVPAERLQGIEPGETLELMIGQTTYQARLRAIIPVENPMTRTRAVRFEPLESVEDAVGAVGQSVSVDLPIGAPRDVTTVHKDAVTPAQGARIVFVVDKENVVQPRPVVLGDAVGSRFEIVDGLHAGDLVVIKGNERLRPGQEVVFEAPGAGDGDAGSGDATADGGAKNDEPADPGESDTDSDTRS